jgi:hypothetical protein
MVMKPETRRKYDKLRYKQVVEYLVNYKLEHGCTDCGYKEHQAALEFDHLPQFKKTQNVIRLAGRGLNAVKKELLKCEVVCSNCHSIRTHNRRKQ